MNVFMAFKKKIFKGYFMMGEERKTCKCGICTKTLVIIMVAFKNIYYTRNWKILMKENISY